MTKSCGHEKKKLIANREKALAASTQIWILEFRGNQKGIVPMRFV